MLDVFCCALGCVILLLLLKMREASIVAEESAQVGAELLESQSQARLLTADIEERDRKLALLARELDETAHQLALVQQERDENARQLALVRTERDERAKQLALVEKAVKTTEGELALVRKKSDDTARALALAQERSTKTDEELALKNVDVAKLSKKLTETEKSQDELQRALRDKEKLRADAMRQSLELTDRLLAAETKLKSSEKRVDDLTVKSTDLAKTRATLSDLEKKLADANVTIIDLQGTKARLADKIDKLQIESEQRFAGIAMTGKNVVFLVDMSGSMDRTDENTTDPTKWPTVRDTLVKVMRSLPDLDQYQVILFSSKYSYLLGSDSQWLRWEREKSIEQVRKAMTAAKPVGDTNLYAAFDEVFRFRGKGLDTIYLLSDGLPTSGPGLTPAEEKTLATESERGVVLARHLRKTIRTNWNAASLNRSRVRINSIGFFYESPDVGAFLWALSRENDGSFVGMSRP